MNTFDRRIHVDPLIFALGRVIAILIALAMVVHKIISARDKSGELPLSRVFSISEWRNSRSILVPFWDDKGSLCPARKLSRLLKRGLYNCCIEPRERLSGNLSQYGKQFHFELPFLARKGPFGFRHDIETSET